MSDSYVIGDVGGMPKFVKGKIPFRKEDIDSEQSDMLVNAMISVFKPCAEAVIPDFELESIKFGGRKEEVSISYAAPENAKLFVFHTGSGATPDMQKLLDDLTKTEIEYGGEKRSLFYLAKLVKAPEVPPSLPDVQPGKTKYVWTSEETLGTYEFRGDDIVPLTEQENYLRQAIDMTKLYGVMHQFANETHPGLPKRVEITGKEAGKRIKYAMDYLPEDLEKEHVKDSYFTITKQCEKVEG